MIKEFTEWAVSDLTAYQCLSTGIDSNVYRIGDYVAKEYQKQSPNEVQQYVELQSAAVDMLRQNPYRVKIDLRGIETELIAETVVPVEWVGLSRNGKPLTFSRFVESTNLEKLLWKPSKFAAYTKAELSDPQIVEFSTELNAFFWDEYPTRGQDELHYHTCMLSRYLGAMLKVFGVYISKYNIKIQPLSPTSIALIVTDLSLYITRMSVVTENSENGVQL